MAKNFFLIIVFVIAAVVYLRHFEFSSLYYPVKQIEITPKNAGLDYQDMTLETTDHQKIAAWLIPFPGSRKVVYFLHGNGGNIGDRLAKISFFHGLGYSVFIIDYRGYGHSSGTPNEKGFYLDALTGYDYLVGTLNVPARRIIVYGESLGGAVAVDLAEKKPVGALIIECSFTSVADVSKRIYPYLPTFLIVNKFDSYSKISRIAAPKFFIHSRDDEIVPYVLGRKLFDKASAPKEFFEAKGGHNDCFFSQTDEIKRVLVAFLNKCDSAG